MPVIKVVDRDGKEQELNAPAKGVLMEPLRDMDDGVTAICGGMCSCATCHVFVDPSWVDRLPKPQSDEIEMIKDLASFRPGGESRLACQIQLSAALDGLKVAIAPEE